jgi:hypothetical protein
MELCAGQLDRGPYIHRVHIFTRDETGLVCLPIQLERTLQLMVNVMKGGGRAPPTPYQPGLILPS